MKIAMLTNNYRPFVGGVPISVERQARELIRLGHEVTVFAPSYGDTEEADRAAKERIVRFHTQKRKMDNGMVYPGIVPVEILERFRREEFDCIHVHHPMFVGPCALYLGRKYDTTPDMRNIFTIFPAFESAKRRRHFGEGVWNGYGGM